MGEENRVDEVSLTRIGQQNMNFFKIKTCWTNAEFIVLKLCIASAYILVGVYFHDFFRYYYMPILILFGITVIWSVYLWLSKMKVGRQEMEKTI